MEAAPSTEKGEEPVHLYEWSKGAASSAGGAGGGFFSAAGLPSCASVTFAIRPDERRDVLGQARLPASAIFAASAAAAEGVDQRSILSVVKAPRQVLYCPRRLYFPSQQAATQ